MFSVAGMDDGGGWPKRFFTKYWHLRRYIGHNRRLVEGAFARDRLTAKQKTRSHLNRSLYLAVQFVAQVAASHWSNLGFTLKGVADTQFCAFLHEFVLERFSNRLDDNKAFGGDATLPCILEAGAYSGLGGGVQVCIIQHDKGI